MTKQLTSLLQLLPSYEYIGQNDPEIVSVEMDNRDVKTGSLFICVRGFTVDGHTFAPDAVSRGAAAVVTEEKLEVDVPQVVVKDSRRAMALIASAFYDYPTADLDLIGITGTNGKTTTSHLIEKVLADAGRKPGLIGTMYTRFDGQVQDVKNTTPESLPLQQTFHKMKDHGVTSAVMEVSSHALEMGRVRGVHYNVAVFTNLSQDHLDYHGTMERYLHAKGLLFAQLGNGYHQGKQPLAVLNSDDEAVEELLKMTAAPVITYGIENEADIRALEPSYDEGGASFTLKTPEKTLPVRLNMVGAFSIYNALAAIAAVRPFGVPLENAVKSLEEVHGVAGRMEKVTSPDDPFTVLVDYAHTPDSLENVLSAVRDFTRGRILTVVGCGGDRDRTKRPLMAGIAERLSDYVYLTSDNPRSEDPGAILNDMKEGMKGQEYTIITDRERAILTAVQEAGEKDVILIAGKGHETYQIIGDRTFDFDDRAVAREAVKALKENE
ncbi:UDP-N-acetylmuramoyl-L-alanyl-D-glutamate--2,6-diaminopimelate ligase [Alteribacter natronophilus]|uniref:UDP-N-acetylmuramoyl-L-alanyl-D-glutamate--2, 6-diaminopimelate ligase n=1 Tax=Alteribacter natronophilus TaxID=2583810 RepID=UPI00110EBB5F|nr:UDP-N-acetylmuramoyl-L-alanyl-D-glutamate--2,6-diaminopimelate ligase [Alteribacter natronophilus]TMW73122.1 UDP-N-acetylmuramoyl-L-alanyl-D-glutamate--2,6-diaminopimelate ligase [Alteribacter natronophilus]